MYIKDSIYTYQRINYPFKDPPKPAAESQQFPMDAPAEYGCQVGSFVARSWFKEHVPSGKLT